MQNATIDTLMRRRSVRSYKADPVPEDLLRQVLEAGVYAPTGMGAQSPTLIAVKDPKVRDELSKMNAKVMNSDSDPYYGAPVVVVVVADKTRTTHVEDGACVLTYLMVAAKALGLASVWVHREREMFETAEGRALLKDWGLDPETTVGVGSIALGYANEEPEAKPRREGYFKIV